MHGCSCCFLVFVWFLSPERFQHQMVAESSSCEKLVQFDWLFWVDVCLMTQNEQSWRWRKKCPFLLLLAWCGSARACLESSRFFFQHCFLWDCCSPHLKLSFLTSSPVEVVYPGKYPTTCAYHLPFLPLLHLVAFHFLSGNLLFLQPCDLLLSLHAYCCATFSTQSPCLSGLVP